DPGEPSGSRVVQRPGLDELRQQRRYNRESGEAEDFGGAYGGNDRCRRCSRGGLSQSHGAHEENPGGGTGVFEDRRSYRGNVIVRRMAGLNDDGAQLRDAAATGVVEVYERKARPGHRILQQRDGRRPRQAMLAAQMQKSADQALAGVSVVITAARPVAVVGKM